MGALGTLGKEDKLDNEGREGGSQENNHYWEVDQKSGER
jgi:hypothetical protein